MVTAADFCLLISNSGETSELRDIVAHTRRFGIPMAAISSKPNSTLMQAADYKLILTQAPLILSVAAATLIGTTLNASGLEVQLNQDFDINREVQSTGVANVLSGVVGGIPGYHVVGETILANRLGLKGALVGLSSAAGCAVLLVGGAGLLTALPVGFFAAVIAFQTVRMFTVVLFGPFLVDLLMRLPIWSPSLRIDAAKPASRSES